MSDLIEVKTVELIGAALDYAVDIAISGEKPGIKHAFAWRYQNTERKDYSRLWKDGGPLIDKYKPWISPPVGNDQDDEPYGWDAEIYSDDGFEQIAHIVGAPTALIAICRAIVFAKLGETVKIPVELMS